MDKEEFSEIIEKLIDQWIGTKRIFLLALFVIVCYWSLESYMDTTFFNKRSFLENFFFITADETWMRLFVASSFFLSGFVLKWFYHLLKKKEMIIKNNAKEFRLFAYSILHDLKSPTISQAGLARILKKRYGKELGEDGQKICDALINSAETSAELVRMINEYIETKSVPLKIEKVNVREVLRIIRDEFSTRMNSRKISWIRPEDLPTIKADRISFIRLFRNLVDNSLKYGGDNLSEIKFLWSETEDHYLFSIIDDGVGINIDDPDKIFLVFERCEGSNEICGSGMGLATVKEIAQKLGGDAWVDPLVKTGTRINISIAKFF